MKEMNGDGIWRSPREHGVGTDLYKPVFLASDEPLERWRRKTISVLRTCLPDTGQKEPGYGREFSDLSAAGFERTGQTSLHAGALVTIYPGCHLG